MEYALGLNAVLDLSFMIPGVGSNMIRNMFKKSGWASDDTVTAIIWTFLLHGIVRGNLAMNPDDKHAIRLGLASYLIEMIYFGLRIRRGRCAGQDAAPAIVIPSAMIVWILARARGKLLA
mmetsp:Transcript_58545/g.131947  ORF Transcript_58545/g.131947 Transcript_58545/m.131947 type:complete len:120 (+) Transcript_58545:91-450(+)